MKNNNTEHARTDCTLSGDARKEAFAAGNADHQHQQQRRRSVNEKHIVAAPVRQLLGLRDRNQRNDCLADGVYIYVSDPIYHSFDSRTDAPANSVAEHSVGTQWSDQCVYDDHAEKLSTSPGETSLLLACVLAFTHIE